MVLLHGFLENSSMWKDIASGFTDNRVIVIDLLGHGQTGCLGNIHTMKQMAGAVRAVLDHLDIKKTGFVGHSMGGYVALAFSKDHPEMTSGLCLMNSTYEADDEERKELRARANAMARQNFVPMVRMSFVNLFDEESHTKHKNEMDEALKEALKTPLQGYMAAQEGMRIRDDHTGFFVGAPFKKALIISKKDSVLNYKKLLAFGQKNGIPTTLLSGGHMSHIENKEGLMGALRQFAAMIY